MKTARRIWTKFFSVFRTKHLFVTTCIEKHYTRPLELEIGSNNKFDCLHNPHP